MRAGGGQRTGSGGTTDRAAARIRDSIRAAGPDTTAAGHGRGAVGPARQGAGGWGIGE